MAWVTHLRPGDVVRLGGHIELKCEVVRSDEPGRTPYARVVIHAPPALSILKESYADRYFGTENPNI